MAEPLDPDAPVRRTFADNLRRLFRREPDMGVDPVPMDCVYTYVPGFVFAAILGAAATLWFPPPPPVVLSVTPAIGAAHAKGVRHRWWALGTAVAVGSATGFPLAGALYRLVAHEWADLIAMLAGCATGTVAYVAVTHIPRRRSSLHNSRSVP